MLGHHYRFAVLNGLSTAVSASISVSRWKLAADGSAVFDSEELAFNHIALANSDRASSITLDNSTDKWLGAEVYVSLDPNAAVDGMVLVELQRSTDGGTTWPTFGFSQCVAGMHFTAASAAAKTMSFAI